MVREIRVYFEGDPALKPGFDAFLKEIKAKARDRRCEFRLIATKATPASDYHIALKSHPSAWNILLLDSEEAVVGSLDELCRRRNMAGHSGSVFWMVQVMESWFLADPKALKRFYGGKFRQNALKGDATKVEEIPKPDVLSCLEAATRGTQKGKYHKTAHPPELLAMVDPTLVRAAAPNCGRLFDALLIALNEP